MAADGRRRPTTGRAVAFGGSVPDRDHPASGASTSAVSLNVADELVEQIAHRAAELVAARSERPAEDGWLRGAERIAAYIDAPRSRVYALVSARRIPVHHDGSALIARRSELDRWLLRGGARRP